ncbi:MAG TPA: nitronate monooxygenase [Mycobacteriales bacterium]|nr:nitronate monooxygenase [Mycobacteriales bacterium]
MRTWLTERFGLTVPVVGAPMFGVGDGRLAAAISNAGGLGMIGVGATSTAAWVPEQCRVAAAAGRPYGVGLMAWALDLDETPFTAVREAAPVLVSIGFGDYQKYVAPLQQAGSVVATQVGNLAEAKRAEQAGVDVIVARGGEGGGHGRNDVATLLLLQEVLDAVSLPVLAAGGIANARGLAAVIAAGAAGGWAGTAFLGCEETVTQPAAREQLFSAVDTDTAYGRVFDIGQRLGWPPEFGGRGLRNRFFDTWTGREDELAADDDAMQELAAARAAGDYDAAYLYTGQGVAMLHEPVPAAAVVAEFGRAAEVLAEVAARSLGMS